jgi:CrcB protein
MRNALLVALGGAVGSVARYGVGVLLAAATRDFPWSTLGINVVGSLVLGAVVAAYPAGASAPRLLLGVGLCGGFTTFSTFGVETLALVERGEAARAAAYVGASVALGLAAAALGLALGRAVAR